MRSLKRKSWKSNKSFKTRSLKTKVAMIRAPKGALTGKEHLQMTDTTEIRTKQQWEDQAKAPSRGAATVNTSQWETLELQVNLQEKDPVWIAEAQAEPVHTAEMATLMIQTTAWAWVSWTATLATPYWNQPQEVWVAFTQEAWWREWAQSLLWLQDSQEKISQTLDTIIID